MKSTYYFSHDYATRSDEKIRLLLSRHGMEGYGIFWSLIEDLYQNANAMRTHYDSIAYALHTQSDVIKSVIHDFGLFEINGDTFSSPSVTRRIGERENVVSAMRMKALKRWNKGDNAQAMHTHSAGNAEAIQLNKIKEKEIINNTHTIAVASKIEILKIFERNGLNLTQGGGDSEFERFVNYYDLRGWKTNDGIAIDDPVSLAKTWTPKQNKTTNTNGKHKPSLTEALRNY